MARVGPDYFYNSGLLIQSIRENDLSYAGKLQIIIHFVADKLDEGTFQTVRPLLKVREGGREGGREEGREQEK